MVVVRGLCVLYVSKGKPLLSLYFHREYCGFPTKYTENRKRIEISCNNRDIRGCFPNAISEIDVFLFKDRDIEVFVLNSGDNRGFLMTI